MNKSILPSTWRQLRYELIIISVIICLMIIMPIITVIALADGSPISLIGSLYNGPNDSTDLYAYGNCTYWVYLLRKQINEPIPNNWGNANTWAIRAENDGYVVNHTPTIGSIMQTSAGALGHVAFVTGVNLLNNTWTISEMNVIGWDMVDTKTLPMAQDINYSFIHNPIGKQTIKQLIH